MSAAAAPSAPAFFLPSRRPPCRLELSVKTWDSDSSDGEDGASGVGARNGVHAAARKGGVGGSKRGGGSYDPDEMLEPAQRLRRAAREGQARVVAREE